MKADEAAVLTRVALIKMKEDSKEQVEKELNSVFKLIKEQANKGINFFYYTFTYDFTASELRKLGYNVQKNSNSIPFDYNISWDY